MKRTLLVTAALPYANGPIHVGHLLEYVQADIWVRYQRLIGNDCTFVCADDAHGTPIMISARSRDISPAALIDEMHASHLADFRAFGVDFDVFHSTHSPENRALVEAIYQRLSEGGHITRRTIAQAYDEQAGMFLPDRFVKGTCPRCRAPDQYGDACERCGQSYAPTELLDARSVLSGAPPTIRESEHLFVRLGALEPVLRAWLESGAVQPEVRNKLIEWFEAGLQDWDVSRDAPYWGFEIPGETGKYFYVWLDAPIGYMAAHRRWCETHGGDFDATWSPGSEVELVHFIGKDIAYFHTLFWPAILHASGHRMPSSVYCHGFLTVNGRKMSKSRGTHIAARTWLEHLDAQGLRYYIAAKLSSGINDVDLALDDFVFRVNADLVGQVVNIASRCCAVLIKSYGNRLATALPDEALYQEAAGLRDEVGALYEQRDYARAMRVISELASRVNRYIDTAAPWALAKDPETHQDGRAVCTQSLNLFRVLVTLLAPVVPRIAEDTAVLLRAPISWSGLDRPVLGVEIERYKPLMMRIDKASTDRVVEASRPSTTPAEAG